MTFDRAVLQQHRLVGQLIGARPAVVWKMQREQSADMLHAGNRSAAKVAASEVPLHLAADLVPLGLRHTLRQAAIGKNLHITVGEQHVDQHTIVVRGIPDAQLAEHLQCALARSQIVPERCRMQRGFNTKRISPACCGFDRGDARLNSGERLGGEAPRGCRVSGKQMTQRAG